MAQSVNRYFQLLPLLSFARNSRSFKKALVPVLFAQQTSKASISSEVKTNHVTKNLEVRCSEKGAAPNNNQQLTLLFCWLMSKKKHIDKFGDYYTRQGFDVLTIRITPWQLLWPISGTQVIAEDVLKFLNQNSAYRNIVVHGFSVGGYVYGEVLNQILENPSVYSGIKDRIVGQIFDSAVDMDGIATGFPKAVTKNKILQKLMELYLKGHMRQFREQATKHYERSSAAFHKNFIHAPSLFFFSKDDPVGTAEGNLRVIRYWEEAGIPVYAKCWESSPHVSHLYRHPDEYLEELSAFLDRIGMLAEPHRRASKL